MKLSSVQTNKFSYNYFEQNNYMKFYCVSEMILELKIPTQDTSIMSILIHDINPAQL